MEPGLRERNKEDKRARIVAAASRLFADVGFEAATGREIARRAGIGTGTLFTYVKDKRELLFLVFREDALRLLEEVERAAPRKRELLSGLMAVFGPFIGFYASKPDLARLYVRELLFRHPTETHGLAELTTRLVAAALGVLRRARERGELAEDVPLSDAVGVVMAQYGFWIQQWLGTGAIRAEQVRPRLRRSLALALRGWGVDGGGDRV